VFLRFILWLLGLLLTSCSYVFQPKDLNCEDDTGEYCAVYTILESKCLNCHSSNNPEGSLDLSTYEEIISSNVIDFDDLESSILLTRIADELDPMPPESNTQLNENEIQVITNWVLNGAQP
jgi:uncharacterized membrane protein